MLYTREFFETVKAHLNPGGVVTLFVQLYESNTGGGEERDRDLPRGVSRRRRLGQYATTAPATTWCCSGQVEPTQDRRRRDAAHAQEPEYAPVAQSLREIGMFSAIDLFSTYAGTRRISTRGWPTR